MATLRGTVKAASGREFDGRNGKVMLYSFQLEGDRRYFRTGTKAPGVTAGETISFEAVEKNGNMTVDPATIEKVAAQDVQRAPAPAPRTGGGGFSGTARDDYWAAKEARDIETSARINFSASQRDAITLVVAALEQDCLSFGNVAKGKKLDMLLDFVDQITDRFVKQREECTNDG